MLKRCKKEFRHYTKLFFLFSRIRDIVINLDLAPTFLDIAGVKVPDHMDGKSILPVLNDAIELVKNGKHNDGEIQRQKSWRDTFLLERGYVF